MFGFKFVQVTEQSMVPALTENDIILIKTHFKKSSIKRNNIIVLRSPLDTNLKLVKRVVGIPNDFIQIVSNGKILINQKELEISDFPVGDEWIEYEWNLGENNFVVLSDNDLIRTKDSKLFGPIKFENIIGIAIFKIKPFSRIK